MRRPYVLLLLMLALSSLQSRAVTLTSVAISPQGSSIQNTSTQQFTVVCTYSDNSTDNCTVAGGATWSTSKATFQVSTAGLASTSTDPGVGLVYYGWVVVKAGGLNDRAGLVVQHAGDAFYQYPTPSATTGTVAVGATVQIGSGIIVNSSTATGNGTPFQSTCNWTTSNAALATVDRYGAVTAVAAGAVTITCGRNGNALFGASTASGWVSPGNTIALTVVAAGTGSATWYVRPDGGTPYVSAGQTPYGQCNGKSNVAYTGTTGAIWIPRQVWALNTIISDNTGHYETVTTAGTGGQSAPTWAASTTDGTAVWTQGAVYPVNQVCAMGNLRYLWADNVNYQLKQWMIAGGDTVIVAMNSNGYNLGLDGYYPSGGTWTPENCHGDYPGCFMPTIPSGSSSKHTQILGANYASCSADTSKTLLIGSWAAYFGMNIGDSQFVDVQCFELTDKAACAKNGNFTNVCNDAGSDYVNHGVQLSALTANVNLTDLFVHGVGGDALRGPVGASVVSTRLHIKGNAIAGIDMDDTPWGVSNISVAGGLTLNYSITEFAGCVEEYPVVHNYPYIECRDQNTGGYGDGFGTASTTGSWSFNQDIWRYNFQDGLDLLHSGMQSLTVTNSASYGNDGQQFKIGSGTTVVFRNNEVVNNCRRILYLFGDEPTSAIVAGVTACRAAGSGMLLNYDGLGADTVQFNSTAGYSDVAFEIGCDPNWDACPNTNAIFQNNYVLGYTDPNQNAGAQSAPFYTDNASMPSLNGWTTRDHNLYYNYKASSITLQPGELTVDPLLVSEVPPLTAISVESTLDNFNFNITSGSPLKGAGVNIPAVTTDYSGATRPNPPSISALEFVNSIINPAGTFSFGTFSGLAR